MRPTAMKVGELARRTGVSVRTLHYYDEISLLSPSHHTEAGHRLYGAADVVRLQQIRSLQQLGLSLDEVRACLDGADCSLLRVIELHLGRLREQIVLQRRLEERLEAVAAVLRTAGEVSVETLMHTMEAISMVEKYYTPEQLAWLQERRQQVGEERIRQVEAEWPQLIAQVRAEMEAGTDPASERVQELARRWRGLIEEFTGGNPEIAQALSTMYQQEESVRQQAGVDQELFAYISQATAASEQSA